jgi:hypothetical protein
MGTLLSNKPPTEDGLGHLGYIVGMGDWSEHEIPTGSGVVFTMPDGKVMEVYHDMIGKGLTLVAPRDHDIVVRVEQWSGDQRLRIWLEPSR